MVKMIWKLFPTLLFLALMAAVTYGGKWLFYASRTTVKTVTAKLQMDTENSELNIPAEQLAFGEWDGGSGDADASDGADAAVGDADAASDAGDTGDGDESTANDTSEPGDGNANEAGKPHSGIRTSILFSYDAEAYKLKVGQECYIYYVLTEVLDGRRPADLQPGELEMSDYKWIFIPIVEIVVTDGIANAAAVLPPEYFDEDYTLLSLGVHLSQAAQREQVYVLPASAVLTDKITGETYVYTITSESGYFQAKHYTQRVNVTVKRYEDDNAVITKGIDQSKPAVAEPSGITGEGQKVLVK